MQVVDQANCNVMGPVVHVAEPCSNWRAVSLFLRAIDNYQRAGEVLRNAHLKVIGESDEDKAAADALYWGGCASEYQVWELYRRLCDMGGLLFAGVGTLAFKAAREAEPQYKELQEGGAA